MTKMMRAFRASVAATTCLKPLFLLFFLDWSCATDY